MCDRILSKIYFLFINRGGPKIGWMDQYFVEYNRINTISIDDERNEPELYATIFSEECRSKVELLYLRLLSEMKGIPYEKSNGAIEALMFLQEVSAIASWKYHCNIGEKMELFVRDFDRLDVTSERHRLHEKAQQG